MVLGGKPSYKCDQCPKTSSRKADLHKHVQKLHTTLDKPIECKICGDTFPDCYQYNVLKQILRLFINFLTNK